MTSAPVPQSALQWAGSAEAEARGFDPNGERRLEPGSRVHIGRGEANEIVVARPVIGGRRSCWIEAGLDGGCTLHHAGHGRRVLLNGQPIASSAALSDGDGIECEGWGPPGSVRFVFRRRGSPLRLTPTDLVPPGGGEEIRSR